MCDILYNYIDTKILYVFTDRSIVEYIEYKYTILFIMYYLIYLQFRINKICILNYLQDILIYDLNIIVEKL